jgi:nicotinamide-nucleotide amidase
LKIELVNTGSELLLGRVLNTHQQWLCRKLSDLGYEVNRQVCVADDGRVIESAVRDALFRADLVIVTGGLGPTSDDITRDLIAGLLGRKLVLDAGVLTKIERYFIQRNHPLPPNMAVQAMVPEGARVLTNFNGTAPGLAIELMPNPFSSTGSKAWLILLPGPPRELHPMFIDSVIPLLKREMPLDTEFVCRTFKTAGLGESMVEHKIAPPLEFLTRQGLELGYCARIGEVDVRLVARGEGAEEMVAQGEKIVRDQLGSLIFGMNDDLMESVIVRLLTERKKTLAIAESCTGGLIAHRITNVPGASEVLISGMVTYSNEAKKSLLGVRNESLLAHGAVSEVVAREMAEGARLRMGTDYAIATTGIAGPGGGSEEKPVGTVFIAMAEQGNTIVQQQFNPFDRETFKFVTSQQVLNLLRGAILAK